MAFPITLNVRDVAAKILEAHEHGRLGYQLPENHPQKGLCVLRYCGSTLEGRTRGCAIGIPLMDLGADHRMIMRRCNEDPLNTSVGHLLSLGVIDTDNEARLAWIQSLHDHACCDPREVDTLLEYCRAAISA